MGNFCQGLISIENELHTDYTDKTDLRGFVGLNRTQKKGKRDDGD